jgi:KaiC/GvpD/RAD55 family RecA-like ATPase
MADEAKVKITGDNAELKKSIDESKKLLQDFSKSGGASGSSSREQQGPQLSTLMHFADSAMTPILEKLKSFGLSEEYANAAQGAVMRYASTLTSMGLVAGGAVVAGLTAAAGAVYLLNKGMNDGVDEVIAMERQLMSLDRQAQATGTNLRLVADNLYRTTTLSRPEAMSVTTQLQNKYPNAQMNFSAIATSIADISERTGQSTGSVISQFDRLMRSATGAKEAYRAMGMQITVAQAEEFQGLVVSNKEREKQLFFLERIKDANIAGESANALANSFQGLKKQLGTIWDDFANPLGEKILPLMKDFKQILINLGPVFESLGKVISSVFGGMIKEIEWILWGLEKITSLAKYNPQVAFINWALGTGEPGGKAGAPGNRNGGASDKFEDAFTGNTGVGKFEGLEETYRRISENFNASDKMDPVDAAKETTEAVRKTSEEQVTTNSLLEQVLEAITNLGTSQFSLLRLI